MKDFQTNLPGVRAIFWVDCSKLTNMTALRAVAGMPIAILTESHPISFFGIPECSMQTSRNGAVKTQSATLTFKSNDILPDSRNIGFVVQDENNRFFLIGGREAPYPVVDIEDNTGDVGSRAAVRTYTVTHKALRTLIQCMF